MSHKGAANVPVLPETSLAELQGGEDCTYFSSEHDPCAFCEVPLGIRVRRRENPGPSPRRARRVPENLGSVLSFASGQTRKL